MVPEVVAVMTSFQDVITLCALVRNEVLELDRSRPVEELVSDDLWSIRFWPASGSCDQDVQSAFLEYPLPTATSGESRDCSVVAPRTKFGNKMN
jgi:hypothetical protein